MSEYRKPPQEVLKERERGMDGEAERQRETDSGLEIRQT